MVLYFKDRYIKSFRYSYGFCFGNNIITTKNKNLQEVKALKQIEYFYFSCGLMGAKNNVHSLSSQSIIYIHNEEIAHNFA